MQKRYWLRGGVIMLVVFAVLFIVNLVFKYYIVHSDTLFLVDVDTPLSLVFLPGVYAYFLYPLPIFGCNFFGFSGSFFGSDHILDPSYCKIITSGIVIGVSLLFYFLIGIVFGWIYGKIKNRG